MSFLKELTDKGATIAWSNVAAHPNLLALGTKDSGGSGFDDYGGELELHKLGFSHEADGAAGTLLGKVKTSARFATIAWSEMATKQMDYPYGLVAGGMGDGTVNVWDPAKLVASHPQPKVSTVQRHTGPVTGLQFNPHKSSSHLLASGGADTEVFIIALDRPDTPNVFVPGPKPNTSRHTAEVTKVAWNSQVSHIMATAAQNGSCIVWDLKQKKPWCELRDSNRAPVTDVAWNPQQGQHLVTASGDDNNPVLKLWDLRSSTTLPLATLAGHTEGVLSVAWCPHDASLLMSCAKDNRTFMWDLFSLQPVYELSPGAGEAIPQETAQMFGGYGKTAQRRYQVSWSPHIPSVVGTCSFDRKVQIFSMNGARTSNGRAPAWHRRPTGASFGFGGRLVSFKKGADAATGAPQGVPHGAAHGHESAGGSKEVTISSVQENEAFVAASRRFEQAMASQSFREFCKEKEASASDSHERKVWQFMQIIFEKNARNQLLAHLGFDREAVARQAAGFVSASAPLSSPPKQNGTLPELSSREPTPPPLPPKAGGGLDAEETTTENGDTDGGLSEVLDAVDLATPPTKAGVKSVKGSGLFDAPAPTSSAQGPFNGGDGGGATNGRTESALSRTAEAAIKRSLVVGNFEAAVQCCMSTGNMADAMILASCGGADLWAKTQAQYFEREAHRRPFLVVVNAIIKSELGGLVQASDLSQWQETLAILSTYAKQEELPALCEALAERLEKEAGDRKSANLCYMCAVKVPKTVEMWAGELRAANAAVGGGTDTKALQEFVEKVSVFTQKPNEPPGEEVAEIFAEYAGILASEGEMETALKYIQGQDRNGAVLLDRLYHAAPHATAGRPVPPFPFERQRIGVSPQSVLGTGGSVQATRGGVTNASAASGAAAAGGLAAGAEPPLPPGWTQLTDPQRGIPYYCNAATGETQWERPPPPAQPHVQQQRPQHRPMGSPAAAANANPSRFPRSPHKPAVQQTSSTMAAGMGTGAAALSAATYAAGTSPSPAIAGVAGNTVSPVAAAQGAMLPRQSNFGVPSGGIAHHAPQPQRVVGAAAPYSNNANNAGGGGGGALSGGMMPHAGGGNSMTMRGIGAGAAIPQGAGRVGGVAGVGDVGGRGGNAYGAAPTGPQALAPPSSSTPEPVPQPAPSDADNQALVAAINGMLGALSGVQLIPSEKKMLGDVTKAVNILFGKMGQGQVDQDTLSKVRQLVDSLQARNITAATGVHQVLANSVWQSHKDWIKGLKYLINLVSRRL